MTFAGMSEHAVLWTCYVEGFPRSERYLGLYGLNRGDAVRFDSLGRFFPFEHYYDRAPEHRDPRAIRTLTDSSKPFLIPWMYRPQGPRDVKCGKELLVPPVALFLLLDDKVETKALFRTLGLATPRSHLRSSGHLMVEKPVRDSAGGIGMRLTKEDARAGHFLEEFIPGCQSIGMQYFLLEQSEFICANEMLFEGETTTFTFYAQRHVPRDQLPPALINECFRLCDYLLDRGYRGLLGIDALVRGTEHYLIEVNPRGIAFLPAFFAAQSLGWSSFITYMNADEPSDGEVVLLDFGRRRKVVRSLRA